MKKLVLALPGNKAMAQEISARSGVPLGTIEVRRFPDGESYVRFLEDLNGATIYLVCTLHRPDEQVMPLYFSAAGARQAGAIKIILIAPYLSYLRQDFTFKNGEVLSSRLFARLLASFLDELITVDPHLHRYKLLSEIYAIPAQVKHSHDRIAAWILSNVRDPVIIGPDEESRQWVEGIAVKITAPFLVLKKIRHGDKRVEVSLPDVAKYRHRTPVLLDDIISTGKTMAETVKHLNGFGMARPVCVAVHAVFAPGSYEELNAAGVAQVVTCNTIPHPSNGIDISELLADLS